MTDEEIMRILEGCRIPNGGLCGECPYSKDEIKGERFCSDALMDDVFSLINRQKAEIERLQEKVFSQPQTVPKLIKQIKVEAIKEFSEKVDELTKHTIDDEYMIWKFKFDSLVEEMECNYVSIEK